MSFKIIWYFGQPCVSTTELEVTLMWDLLHDFCCLWISFLELTTVQCLKIAKCIVTPSEQWSKILTHTVKALLFWTNHSQNFYPLIQSEWFWHQIIAFNTFCIYSPGGVVTAGLGIYDTMQYILPPIATWCVGQASSMGSLLLTAGSPGMRHSLPNSRIMVHQPSGQAVVRIYLTSTPRMQTNTNYVDGSYSSL